MEDVYKRQVLNKRTISLSYMGSDGDLEVLKTYLAGLEWQVKRGVKALGLYERDGRWAYVDRARAFAAGGEEVADMVQMEKCASIETALPEHPPISAERLMELGAPLLSYNEPAKTVTVLAWCAQLHEPFCGDGRKMCIRDRPFPEMDVPIVAEAAYGPDFGHMTDWSDE